MKEFDKLVNDIFIVVKKEWINEIKQQGHSLTGSLEKSLEVKELISLKAIILNFFANNYGNILDKGTKANRIPYTEGSGRKTSKYIEGLKDFAKKRFMLDDKSALNAAFAIAKKQKQEGMPTKNSFKFSKNGRRKQLIDFTLSNSEKQINKIIENAIFEQIINFNFDV